MTNNFSNSTSHDQTKQQWTTGTESIFVCETRNESYAYN